MKTTNELDRVLRPDFRYRSGSESYTFSPSIIHTNPYHERISAFSQFVLRDEEAEVFCGRWNKDVFKRPDASLHVEIGVGYGDFMRKYCVEYPEVNFVGIDYRFKRSFNVAKKLDCDVKNALDPYTFRLLRARGERINYIFGESEVDKLFIFFPDPWPKKRHHKKRLLQSTFLRAAHRVLKPNGLIYIKTDHDSYYDWMNGFYQQEQELFAKEFCSQDLWAEKEMHELIPLQNSTFLMDSGMQKHEILPAYQILTKFRTKFEDIFVKKGIKIKALILRSLKKS